MGQWIRRRPLVAFAVCFGAGVALGLYWGGAPLIWGAAAGCLLAAYGLGLRRAALVLLSGVLAGACLGARAAQKPALPAAGEDRVIEGVVDAWPREEETRLVLELKQVTVDGEPAAARAQVYLSNRQQLTSLVRYGQRLRLTGRVWLPDGQRNPGGYDWRAALWRKGVGFCVHAPLEGALILEGARPTLAGWSLELRHALKGRIERLFPNNAPLLCALVLGDKSDLPEELTEGFRRAGISHLLAISGLHVGLLAAMVLWVLTRLLPSARLVFPALAAFLFVYAMMIGFPASVVRAALMLLIVQGARLTGRPRDGLTGLAAAFVAVLAVRPLSLTDAGFVLSFSAVAGILLLAPTLERMAAPALRALKSGERPRRLLSAEGMRWGTCRLLRPVISGLAVSLAAQLGTLPATAALFHRIPLMGLLVNVVAIPATTLVLAGGLAALVLDLVGLGALAALPVDVLMGWVAGLAQTAGGVRASLVWMSGFPPLLCAAYALACLMASPYLPGSWRVRVAALALLPALCLVPPALSKIQRFPGLEVVFVDAGQADATLVSAEGRGYLMDVGLPEGDLENVLLARGQRVEAVFLSHPHADHAGGLERVLEVCDIGALYLPECWDRLEADEGVAQLIEEAQARGTRLYYLAAGDSVQLSDQVALSVLSPPRDYAPSDANRGSLVLRLEYGLASLMLTGDITSREEGSWPQTDLVQIPHHGSAHSSSLEWLEALAPRLAVIPVGYNSYGHPARPLLERLTQLDIPVLRTDRHGAVTVRLYPDDTMRVTTFLTPEEQ